MKSAKLIGALACVGGAQTPSRWASFGLGAGPYAVSMRGDTVSGGGGQDSRKVSPRAALGVTVGAEAPFIAGSTAGMTIGLRGLAFPFAHGESVYMGLLTLGFRRW
jgi:hypothetical protein